MTDKEVLQKYENVKLKFSEYYKYGFTFVGETNNGETLYAYVGQGGDSIYKFPVSADKEETIKTLSYEAPTFIRVEKDGKTVIDLIEIDYDHFKPNT